MRLRSLLIVGLVAIAACQRNPTQPTQTTVTTSTAAVTVLESPQPIPPTQVEVVQPTQTTTTTTIVERTLTELNAQKTSEGIRINLPEKILFDFDKYDIRPTAKPTLEKLSLLLRNYKGAPVQINGHTDAKGSDDYNQTLSENRAKSVKNYLVKNFGVDGDRLTTEGFGKKQPIAPNNNADGSDNPNGRQKNRRVEVIIRNT